MSFFSTDPNNDKKAHFHVGLPYNHKENHLERRERRKRDAQRLKDKGFKTEYIFQFWTNDEKSKATAKTKAELRASIIQTHTGVVMEVAEGFFL